METLDLDIENYDLEDILKLFHLEYGFGEPQLKKAYRIALKTHPDKSHLDPSVFQFFMKAYKVLSRVYYFRKKRQECTRNPQYVAPVDKEKGQLLRKLDGKSITEFNSWFNTMFEKARVTDNENDGGYDEWYRKGEVQEEERVHLSQFGREFERRKVKCKSMIVHRGIEETGGAGGYSLDREKPAEYSAELFSKLPYEDLKKAHTETVVPVSDEDFRNKKKFSSVDSYKRHRAKQDTGPISLVQSKRYLAQRTRNEDAASSRRAFTIIRRDEEIEKKNSQWWAHLKQLTN